MQKELQGSIKTKTRLQFGIHVPQRFCEKAKSLVLTQKIHLCSLHLSISYHHVNKIQVIHFLSNINM